MRLSLSRGDNLRWSNSDDIPQFAREASSILVPAFEEHGLYLSNSVDLEHDLAEGPMTEQLKEFFKSGSPEKAVEIMQRRKAENMYAFVGSNPDFSVLADDLIISPLNYLVSQVKGGEH